MVAITAVGYDSMAYEHQDDQFQDRNQCLNLYTVKDARVGIWAKANHVEIADTLINSSWLNRIEAQFPALRYFTLDGIDHISHKE